MDASNCIVINAPMAAKVHQLGRLVASCDNVVWYDYPKNGKTPWEYYNDVDVKFTKYHFNRRFKGATGKGLCSKTIDRVGSKTNNSIEHQQQHIQEWSKRLSPNMFVYPHHESVLLSRQIFTNSKEIFIIPDLDSCVDRFMETSIHYFVDPQDKEFTYGDLFLNNKEWVRKHLQSKIKDLKDNVNKDVFVVYNVLDMLEENNFKKLCEHIELDFNLECFAAVKSIID